MTLVVTSADTFGFYSLHRVPINTLYQSFHSHTHTRAIYKARGYYIYGRESITIEKTFARFHIVYKRFNVQSVT